MIMRVIATIIILWDMSLVVAHMYTEKSFVTIICINNNDCCHALLRNAVLFARLLSYIIGLLYKVLAAKIVHLYCV